MALWPAVKARHETFPPDDLAGCRLEICHWERRTAGQGGRKSWCRDLYLQVALKMKFQRELILLPVLRWSGKIIFISSFAEPVFHKLGSWRREISGLTCWNLLPGCRRWDWENTRFGLSSNETLAVRMRFSNPSASGGELCPGNQTSPLRDFLTPAIKTQTVNPWLGNYSSLNQSYQTDPTKLGQLLVK